MKAWAWLLALSACAAPPTPFSSYHSPDDTLDALQPELMAARANAIFETLVLLSRADWGFVR